MKNNLTNKEPEKMNNNKSFDTTSTALEAYVAKYVKENNCPPKAITYDGLEIELLGRGECWDNKIYWECFDDNINDTLMIPERNIDITKLR